jgi:hypothetical protein
MAALPSITGIKAGVPCSALLYAGKPILIGAKKRVSKHSFITD